MFLHAPRAGEITLRTSCTPATTSKTYSFLLAQHEKHCPQRVRPKDHCNFEPCIFAVIMVITYNGPQFRGFTHQMYTLKAKKGLTDKICQIFGICTSDMDLEADPSTL